MSVIPMISRLIDGLTEDELEDVANAVLRRIESITGKTNLTITELSKAPWERGKRVSNTVWARVIDEIDDSQRGAFQFQGDWIRLCDIEDKLTDGSMILVGVKKDGETSAYYLLKKEDGMHATLGGVDRDGNPKPIHINGAVLIEFAQPGPAGISSLKDTLRERFGFS